MTIIYSIIAAFSRSNCNFGCMKAFRKFYQRPYFIPPMVGVSEENFVLVGQKETGNNDDSYDTTQVQCVDYLTITSK